MNTITWKIEQLRIQKQIANLENVVVEATWLCEAKSDSAAACKTGIVNFQTPAANFIPFENLQEGDVLRWCYENGVDRESVEQEASDLLGQQEAQPEVVKLPWEDVA
jgi:hypothetical protein